MLNTHDDGHGHDRRGGHDHVPGHVHENAKLILRPLINVHEVEFNEKLKAWSSHNFWSSWGLWYSN